MPQERINRYKLCLQISPAIDKEQKSSIISVKLVVGFNLTNEQYPAFQQDETPSWIPSIFANLACPHLNSWAFSYTYYPTSVTVISINPAVCILYLGVLLIPSSLLPPTSCISLSSVNCLSKISPRGIQLSFPDARLQCEASGSLPTSPTIASQLGPSFPLLSPMTFLKRKSKCIPLILQSTQCFSISDKVKCKLIMWHMRFFSFWLLPVSSDKTHMGPSFSLVMPRHPRPFSIPFFLFFSGAVLCTQSLFSPSHTPN